MIIMKGIDAIMQIHYHDNSKFLHTTGNQSITVMYHHFCDNLQVVFLIQVSTTISAGLE